MKTVEPPRSAIALSWVGRLIGGVALAILLLDAWLRFGPPPALAAALRPFGFHVVAGGAPFSGAAILAGSALYAFRRTAIGGAVLLTVCLGMQAAVERWPGNPVFGHLLASGAVLVTGLWLGLVLGSARVTARRKLQVLTLVFGALPALALLPGSLVGLFAGLRLVLSSKLAGLLFIAMGLGGVAGCIGLLSSAFRTSPAVVLMLSAGLLAALLAMVIFPAVAWPLLLGPVAIGAIRVAGFVRGSAPRGEPGITGERRLPEPADGERSSAARVTAPTSSRSS